MDPSEAQAVAQYMQMFGHPPPGITPENLKLIQALQAAKAQSPAQPQPSPQGVPIYNAATPGVGGALQDAIGAIAKSVAPKSITQRKQRLDQLEAESQ